MPNLSRPDGATIHWEQCGDGPTLYAVHNVMIAMPSTFAALLDDLALDHRVVTWDPRGAGESSRDGRYDFDTDADDLAALVEEVGAPGVFVVLGFNPLPLALADRRPQAVTGVVLVAGTVQLQLSDSALFDSESVITAMLQMARTDPRALLRSTVTLGNPQLSEAELHERLEAQLAYCPVESWVGRTESYIGIDARRPCSALGDRLWIVYWPNPISPESPVERLRALLPHAHIVETEDGPISRPDLVAAVVRQATASPAVD